MPAHSISELESFIKSSASSAARLLTMQQQDKQKDPGSSSPLSPSLSFFNPSPYILNCKRRACGSWETRDALSGAWGTKDTSHAVKSKEEAAATPTSFCAEDPPEKQGGFFVSCQTGTGRLSSLNDQLVELRDALEKFISECSCSPPAEENKVIGTLEAGGVDLQTLRRKSVRGKILAEILSSKVYNMKPQADQVLKAGEGDETRETQADCFSYAESSPSRSPADEFFDARDASSSDGGYSSSEEASSHRPQKPGFNALIDSELVRQLQLEVKRRMKAEEALQSMHQCQQEIVKILLLPGSSSPPKSGSPPPVSSSVVDHGLASLIDEDWQDEDCQRTIIATVISSALLRGAIRPDEAEALKKLLASKDRETSRLRRKLKFYEQVNHELSHKNQEATERARRIRRNRQRWLNISVKCLVAGVAVGVSGTLLYWYFPWDRFKSVKSRAIADRKEIPAPPERK